MKKITLALMTILLTGGLVISMVQAKDDKVKYRSAFDIKYSYCEIKTNGFTGMSNHSSAISGRGFGTSSTAAMFALENGENEISVEFGGLNWFNPEIEDDKEKSQFNPEAYCNLEFVKIQGADITTLDSISVAIDKNGQPYAREEGVKMKVRKEKGVIPGFIPDEGYSVDAFPKNMPLYEFKKKVVVSGLPEWAWTKAEEYKDTPEQRSKLQKAYEALWQDFNRKDLNAIKAKYKIALKAWAYSTDSTPDAIFKDFEIEGSIKRGYKMYPINWDGYDVKIMNNGKMVRLINKSNLKVSPIIQIFGDEFGFYAPTFSLINGEFVIVL